MRSLVKLAVVLLCVQRGEGRWLRSPVDQEQKTAPPSGDPRDPRDGRTPPAPGGPSTARSRRSAPLEPPCGLRSVLLQVRDLGLGYDSDETVLFKYCGGACPHLRSNHDLTLANLLLSGALPEPGGLWHDAPCCRPTHHEDMVFLDNSHRWHRVEKLSAAGCSCVG
ncbi:persephin isoform 1-T2 [Spinachia spinachia]